MGARDARYAHARNHRGRAGEERDMSAAFVPDASQPNRLPVGGLVDRARALSFRFDGTPYRGYAGDTLASALLASGVKLFGRSFKYYRPRGVLTAGSEEPNALAELRTGA